MTISDSDIAIIGMACRFPGADSVERFWELLREAQESLIHHSDAALLAAGVPPERLADPHYVKAAQTIAGIDQFDSELFQIPHDEADILDPQHRLFLECAFEAFERAGYDPERAPGAIGVYAGAGMNTYLMDHLIDRYRRGSSAERFRLMLANDKDFLATRVCYKLNLRGPGVTINTATSTSLVAVHAARQGLLAGECDIALAGAVHLLPATAGYDYQAGMIFSPDGHCRAFDAQSQGTIFGSGVGVVILKRLADALADRDWIHAVIKGTAVNNDGADKSGYTAPSIDGQAAVIAAAQAAAGVSPETIGYVEAHGTGTPIGDPIEVAALTRAFRRHTDAVRFCALGSVKTNIGHLNTAAGIAGLIKTALMLEHRTLVPTLHFKTPNPRIDFAGSPFFVSTRTTAWQRHDGPLRAGVSSFGLGGTNAHAVLEQPPARSSPARTRECELLLLSARSEAALRQTAEELARHLGHHPEFELAAVAATLALGRRPHPHRLALVAADSTEAAARLAQAAAGERAPRAAHPCRPVLVLSAEGIDRHAAQALWRGVDSYRAGVERCAAALGRPAEDGAVQGVEVTIAGFVHEYATAMTLISSGLIPAGVAATGQVGLAVAAALTGALALEQALAWAAGAAPGGFGLPRWPLLRAQGGGWMSEEQSSIAANWTAHDHLNELLQLLEGAATAPVPLTAGRARVSGLRELLALVGELWVQGVPVAPEKLFEGSETGRVPLPPRPFARRRHWIDPSVAQGANSPAAGEQRRGSHPARAGGGHDPARVTAYLIEEIGKLLGGAQHAKPEANLFELGLDSMMLVEVAARLARALGLEVPATAFVEFPTIRAFVENLTQLTGVQRQPEADRPTAGRLSRRAQRAAAARG